MQVSARLLAVKRVLRALSRQRRLAILAAVALGWLWVRNAEAGTETGTLLVGASVGQRCTVIVLPMTFGTYDPMGTHASTPLDVASGVSLNCAPGSVVRVQLDQGLNPAAGSTDADPLRQMSLGSESLQYNLYVDSAYTRVFGNSAPGERPTGAFPLVMPIYGRVAEAQFLTSGTYTDTVTVTVTF